MNHLTKLNKIWIHFFKLFPLLLWIYNSANVTSSNFETIQWKLFKTIQQFQCKRLRHFGFCDNILLFINIIDFNGYNVHLEERRFCFCYTCGYASGEIESKSQKPTNVAFDTIIKNFCFLCFCFVSQIHGPNIEFYCQRHFSSNFVFVFLLRTNRINIDNINLLYLTFQHRKVESLMRKFWPFLCAGTDSNKVAFVSWVNISVLF